MSDGVTHAPDSVDENATADKAPAQEVTDSGGDRAIELVDVVVLVNGFPALAGLSLSVSEREIVLVEGPNGAGKSTLLRLLAGLSSPHQGSARILGHDPADRHQRRLLRREAGLLAHQTYLYDELTVEQNIEFWAGASRVEPEATEPVLERLGLAGRLRRVPVSGLSAGQRRRASLAVLVSRRPRLWLLDEPHAGLDSAGRDLIDELIVQAANAGATVIISSHDIDRAKTVATRTMALAGGTLRGSEALKGGSGVA